MAKKTFGPQLIIENEVKRAQVNARKIVEEAYNEEPMKWYEMIIFSWVYLIIALVSFPFLIGVVLILFRKSMWGKRVKRVMPLDQAKAYQQLLESTYNNIKVSDLCTSEIPRKLLETHRGIHVPLYAWISSVTSSPIITINKSDIIMNEVTWEYRLNKTTVTKTKWYAYITPTAQRFNDLTFSIAKRGMINFNFGKDMDNDRFNKAYSYKHNNGVKFRMLFTVAAQEKYVALSETLLGTALKIDKTPNFLMMSYSSGGTPFELNASVTLDANKLKQEVSDDLANDVEAVLKTIIPIANLKGIFEK